MLPPYTLDLFVESYQDGTAIFDLRHDLWKAEMPTG